VQQGKFVNGEFIKPFTCKEVKIGNQIWMAENLNVSKFRNGDPILEAKSNEEWVEAGFKEKPAWCYYNNDPTNESRYGKLYNYYAVIDPRGLAPDGWRIPTEFDFNTLDNYLTENTAGKKMKNTSGWSNNGNGTNESGFSALPGGYRQAQNGFFFNLYESGGWWSITDLGFNTLSSGYHGLGGNRDDGFSYVGVWLGEGVSVRCIKN
jgi:uncharacterized protein (TIGR02145 family)